MPYPRKPTHLKIAQGTYRPDRANPKEPKPDPGVPPCPPELDEAAREEWERIAPLLLRLRTLAATDLAVLSVYCASWSRWRRAERELAAHGEVFITPNGHQQRSPWTTIAREAFAALEKCANHLSLSAMARTKVTADPAALGRRPWEDNPLLGGRAVREDLLADEDEDPAEAYFTS